MTDRTLREALAIRRKLDAELAGLTPAEQTALVKQRADAVLARYGIRAMLVPAAPVAARLRVAATEASPV